MKIHIEADKLKLWCFVCILSAAPSFYWALQIKANIPAMLVGISLFIIGYTAITSSDFYKKLKQKPFLFKALRWAFKIRVFYSIISIPCIIIPKPFASLFFTMINMADCWLGLISSNAFRMNLQTKDGVIAGNDFFPTLLTTITQGFLLSFVVFLVAIVLWFLLRVINILFTNKMV